MSEINKHSDKMAWGAILIAFGALILLDRMNFTFAPEILDFLSSPGTYFLVAGIIFLILKKEKTLGLVLTIVGLIIHSDVFFGWMDSYRTYLIPVILVAVGIIMVLTAKKGRR